MRKGMDEREGSKIGGILDVVYGRPLSLSFSYLLHAAHKRMRTVTNYFLVILKAFNYVRTRMRSIYAYLLTCY